MGALIEGGRGWYGRIGGKQRWICSKRTHTRRQAEVVFHRKAAAITRGELPLAAKLVTEEPDAARAIVHDVLNLWVLEQRHRAEDGSITPGAFKEYLLSCKRIDRLIGEQATADVSPDLLKQLYQRLARAHGRNFARRAIGHFRTACRDAADSGWCAPVRLGVKVLRKYMKSGKGTAIKWRLYSPEDVRRILAALRRRIHDGDGRTIPSDVQLYAMILLALNGGYGAMELAALPRVVIDLRRGVLDFSRGKTGADHVVPLWRETVAALRAVMRRREYDPLLFRTRQGNPWRESKPVYVGGKLRRTIEVDNVAQRFNGLVKPLGLKVKGQSFYKLKHVHATHADEAGDPHATYALAGHKLPGAKRHYVRVGEQRLRAVVAHIHDVLLGQQIFRGARARGLLTVQGPLAVPGDAA